MNDVRRATLGLTLKYSIVFFLFTWILSGGIYLWVDNSLGEGYLDRLNSAVRTSEDTTSAVLSQSSASVLADVTIDRLRNILIIVNGAALIIIPLLAYSISRRTLLAVIESQRSQQAFIANASHELRTPLAVMLSDLDWALKKKRSEMQYVDTITNTRSEVLSMSNMIHGLLGVSRLHDRRVTNLEPVDVADIVARVSSHYADAAKKKQMTIDADAAPVTVAAKPDLLLIVLNNLIDNAIKHGDERTTVIVAISLAERVTITVSNVATGLKKSDLNRIFERFYRLDKVDASQGHGLGLAITKQIVEALGGTIHASLDDGIVRFIVTLRSHIT